jgi:hypothetical protein
MIPRFFIALLWVVLALFCAGKLALSLARYSYDSGYHDGVKVAGQAQGRGVSP